MCWGGERGVCLKEQSLWIITSEPASQVRQQSTTYFRQREQHQNELLYIVLSLSLLHKNRYIQGLDAQTFLSVPPETSSWYSSRRNNWFFSCPAYINRDRKFIALIQRQILKLCLQNFNRSTEKTHCVFLDRDCSNQTQTTKAQRHKLRTVTHTKKIIFAHITCGIRIIYTATFPPFFVRAPPSSKRSGLHLLQNICFKMYKNDPSSQQWQIYFWKTDMPLLTCSN